MNIDDYEFGKITIEDRTFTNDVIIFPHWIKENWWREEGHLLQVKDLEDVFAAKPHKLIVGTGASGMMKIADKVIERCNGLGIELMIEKSEKACELYNHEKDDAVLAIHLTC